jgi:hypothetical protein
MQRTETTAEARTPRRGRELGLKLALIPAALLLLAAISAVAVAADVVSQASPLARGVASAATLLGAVFAREWARARRRSPGAAWLLALGAGR